MRLILFILITTTLSLFATGTYSQNAKVSIDMKNSSVREVLSAIEKTSEFFFIYNNELIDVERKVDLNVKDQKIGDILTKLFRPEEVEIAIVDRKIILAPAYMRAQQQKVTGIITDATNGEPIIGANIVIEGTTIGTTTDIDGKFNIDVSNSNAVLLISYLGYNSERIQLDGRSTFDIKLIPDIKNLDEVVVIGYQVVKKRDVIGSVSSVNSKDLGKTSVANFAQALQGRTPGVIATQQSGQPGSGVLVEIRGAGGFGGQPPLYIVDGVVGANGSSVNPADIESVDVLKDAGTASIYGARGANGVVIITTKRGNSGPVKVKFESYYGVQNLTKKMDVLNTREYIDFIKAYRKGAGSPPVFQFSTPAKVDSLAMNNTDWQDQIFRKNAPIQNYNLNVSGGNDKASFSLSTNYFNQEGILLDTYHKRYSVRINSDFKAGKIFKFGESLSLVRINQRNNDNNMDWTNIINASLKLPPYLPPYDTDPSAMVHVPGNTNGWPSGVQSWEGNDLSNPLTSSLVDYQPRYNEIQGSLYGQISISKNFFYKLNLGLNYNDSYNSLYIPIYYSGPYQSNNRPRMSKDGSNNQNILIENTLNFNKLFAEKHNVSAIAGLSRQNFQYEGFSLGTNDLPNEDVRNISAGGGSNTRFIGGSISEYRLFSVFGRLNYDYSGKYLFSATFRRDGTSRFGPNRKFGNFPAFSAGWRISEESFLKDVSFISDLKLFASWGKMGSDQIADFQYLPMVSLGNNNYNLGATGAGNEVLYVGSRLGGFANEDLQWQANVTSNIGVNLGILDNKFILSAEYFVKKTDKLLQNVTIPTSSGYGSIYMNAGAVENKGVDLQLMYQQNFGDFHIDVAGNFSTLKNNVTSLGSSRSAIYGGQILPSQLLITKTDIGQPIGSFYGYKYVGIYQDTASIIASPHIVGTRPGDIQYVDINGGGGALDSLGIPNGRITDKDKTFIGNPWPKFVYGLSVNASYKGFDFNMFLQGVYGNAIFNVQNGYFGDGYQGRYNAYARVLDSWTPQNRSTSQHRLGNESVNFVPSSRMVEKGSFLRLKNIQVGYTLPGTLVNKVGIQRLRVFVSSQNLFTITNYSGYDPEIGARSNSNLNKGIDVGNYPQARSLMAGLQVDF